MPRIRQEQGRPCLSSSAGDVFLRPRRHGANPLPPLYSSHTQLMYQLGNFGLQCQQCQKFRRVSEVDVLAYRTAKRPFICTDMGLGAFHLHPGRGEVVDGRQQDISCSTVSPRGASPASGACGAIWQARAK